MIDTALTTTNDSNRATVGGLVINTSKTTTTNDWKGATNWNGATISGQVVATTRVTTTVLNGATVGGLVMATMTTTVTDSNGATVGGLVKDTMDTTTVTTSDLNGSCNNNLNGATVIDLNGATDGGLVNAMKMAVIKAMELVYTGDMRNKSDTDLVDEIVWAAKDRMIPNNERKKAPTPIYHATEQATVFKAINLATNTDTTRKKALYAESGDSPQKVAPTDLGNHSSVPLTIRPLHGLPLTVRMCAERQRLLDYLGSPRGKHYLDQEDENSMMVVEERFDKESQRKACLLTNSGKLASPRWTFAKALHIMFQPPLSLEDEEDTFYQQFYIWKHGRGPHYQAPFCDVVDSIFSYERERELMVYIYNPYCNISNHFLLVKNKPSAVNHPISSPGMQTFHNWWLVQQTVPTELLLVRPPSSSMTEAIPAVSVPLERKEMELLVPS